MNILIVKLSAIGDVIHTLPALNAIRKHYPDAYITWLVEEDAAPLVENHEALDRVLVSKRKRWMKALRSASFLSTIKEISGFIKVLRDTHYDIILDFQALLKSGILIALARGRRKIGFGKGLEHMEYSYIFLNERIPAVDMEIHALSRGMLLIESLGVPGKTIEYKLPVTDSEYDMADELLRQGGVKDGAQVVAINPVAKWGTKLWPAERFAHVADKIIEQYDKEIVFSGAPEDRSFIDQIISNMENRSINLAGKSTLTVLAALYEKSELVISTDTGPMHLAVAVRTPVVALFGPTAPWRTGPYGSLNNVVRVEMACSPCFKRTCETIECMHQIGVHQVMEAVASIVEKMQADGYPPF